MQPFIIAGGLIFLAGLVDDVRGLGPVPKLMCEFAAAGLIMMGPREVEVVVQQQPAGAVPGPIGAPGTQPGPAPGNGAQPGTATS